MSTLDGICKSGDFPSNFLFHITGMPWAATNSPALKTLLDGGGATAIALKKEFFGIVGGSNPPDVDILCILKDKGALPSITTGYDQTRGLSVGSWSVNLDADNPAGSSFDGAGSFTAAGLIGVTWQPARTTQGAKYSVLSADLKTSQPSSPPIAVIYWPAEKDFGLKDWLDSQWNGASYDNPCYLWVGSQCVLPSNTVGTSADGTEYSVGVYTGVFNTPIEDVMAVRDRQNIFITNFPQAIAGMTANLYSVDIAADGTLNDTNTTPYLLATGKVKPGTKDNGKGVWNISVGGFTDQLKIKTAADRFKGHLKGYQFNTNDTDGRYNTGVGDGKKHMPHIIAIEYNTTTDTVTTEEIDLATGGDGYVDFDTLDEVINAGLVALNASSLNCSYEQVGDDIKYDSPDTDNYEVILAGMLPFICGWGYIGQRNMLQLLNALFRPTKTSLFAPLTDYLDWIQQLELSADQSTYGTMFGVNGTAVHLQSLDDNTTVLWLSNNFYGIRNRCTCEYFYQYDLAQADKLEDISPPLQFAQDAVSRPTPENDSGERGFHYTNTSYIGLQVGQKISFGPSVSGLYFISGKIASNTGDYFTMTDNEVIALPWALYWPSGMQEAMLSDTEYKSQLIDLLNTPHSVSSGSSLLSSISNGTLGGYGELPTAPTGLDDITANYSMADPFELQENSASFQDSPITLIKDLLGDPDVTQIFPDSIRDTSIKDLFDRSDYNPREIIDWDSLQNIIDESGLDDCQYALVVAAESSTGNTRVEIPILDMIQGVCLSHGARMVWEWSEAKRTFHLTFVSEGGQSVAEATIGARVVPNGGFVEGKEVTGMSGGDWYFARVTGQFNAQSGSQVAIGIENEDARLRHTLKDKTLGFEDSMTYIPSDSTGAVVALKDRFSAYLQRWSVIQYRHKAYVTLANLCRLPVGASVLFNELPIRDMTVGKHNQGDILGDVRRLTVDLGAGNCVVEFVVDPLARLAIAPTFTFTTFTRTTTTVEIAGLVTVATGNTYAPSTGLVESAYFDCWDYNKATGEVEARDCSCGDYAVTIFEVNAAQNYSAGGSQNMWRGTIEVTEADLAAGTCTVELATSNNFAASTDGKTYAVVFSQRADSNMQACQTAMYGWLGNSNGIVTDSGAVEYPAITVGT